MPDISAVSLARVVAQAQASAQAGGYTMGPMVPGKDWNPSGFQSVPYAYAKSQSGLNPQPLPPGSLMQGKAGVGIGRILRTLFMPRGGKTYRVGVGQVGQTYGSFGPPSGTPPPPPLCSDHRFWIDGAPPGNCVQTVPCSDTRYWVNGSPPPGCTRKVIPIHIPKSEPPGGPPPPAPPPCAPQPCAPQPCSPSPCVPTDGGPIGGPLGGMQVCPPCRPPIPWGWFVIASSFAFLGSLQFYGKVGGGKLS